MKLRHILGAVVAGGIIGIYGLVFMCYCKAKTGQWWIDGEKNV